MKLDRIVHTAAGSFRVTAGAPVIREGRCFAPVSLSPVVTCRRCSGSGWAPDEKTEG